MLFHVRLYEVCMYVSVVITIVVGNKQTIVVVIIVKHTRFHQSTKAEVFTPITVHMYMVWPCC